MEVLDSPVTPSKDFEFQPTTCTSNGQEVLPGEQSKDTAAGGKSKRLRVTAAVVST